MRRGIATGAVVALVALSGCGGSDSESGTKEKADKPGLRSPAQVGDFDLEPVDKGGDEADGTASVRKLGGAGGLVLVVSAELPPSAKGEAYEVWVYNDKSDAKSLGAQVTGKQGEFLGRGPLPSGYRRYRYVDVSREKVNKDGTHSGISVLRGELTAP